MGHTHTDIHTHNLEVALLKLYLLTSYLCEDKTDIRSPLVSGYPRVQFPSLHFPPGCLRLTGPRNKTSMRNFTLTSPIFTRQEEEKWKECHDRAACPFLPRLPFSEHNNTGEEGRGEKEGVHLNLMTDKAHTLLHTHTQKQQMNTHTHTHSRDAAWGKVS